MKVLSALLAVVAGASLLVFFILTLAGLELLSEHFADVLGYQLKISDEVAKTVVGVGGAFGVAVIALYGVHYQTISAERRHKVDSRLALRKEIFLEVAEAAAVQYQFLLSFADPEIIEAERAKMAQEIGKTFYKLQMVASTETIEAMLDANEEWTRAMIDIRLMGQIPEGLERLKMLCEIQCRATPFMRALWRLNVLARKEIESGFEDDEHYLSMMDEKYARVPAYFDEVRMRLASI
jgi:hypothetical protein